jgi:transposase
LASDPVDDLRRLDRQLSAGRTRLVTLVAATRTSTTDIFGVGSIIAATGNAHRFATADRFSAYTGTAPIEASSGPGRIYRLSRRGNRQLNHAVHMAAVTQIRNRHTAGGAYYDRKLNEGMSPAGWARFRRRPSSSRHRALSE